MSKKLTHDFRETVRARARRDPEFAVECAAAIADGMADDLAERAAEGLADAPSTAEQVINGYRMIAKRIRKELK